MLNLNSKCIWSVLNKTTAYNNLLLKSFYNLKVDYKLYHIFHISNSLGEKLSKMTYLIEGGACGISKPLTAAVCATQAPGSIGRTGSVLGTWK